MKNYKKLTEAEKIIMEVVWQKDEVSNADIMKELEGIRDWSRHTVKTYMRHLNEKGIVGIRRINARFNMYYPLVSKEDYMANQTATYLKKNYNGLTHMVSGLMQREEITDEEVEELEKLIKDYKNRSK